MINVYSYVQKLEIIKPNITFDEIYEPQKFSLMIMSIDVQFVAKN